MLKILQEVTRFAAFLNARPNADELLIRLATDFLSHLNPKAMTLAALVSAKKFEPIHQWGEPKPIDYQSLEKDLHTDNLVASLATQGLMRNSKEKEELISPITNGKVVAGALHCACENKPSEDDIDYAKTIMALTSTYLFPKIVDNNQNGSLTDLKVNPLTPRQRQVLAGFVEGKTNHEMALELGFSISTIRHETMAIFKTLGASDRKEAAKLAQKHGLI